MKPGLICGMAAMATGLTAAAAYAASPLPPTPPPAQASAARIEGFRAAHFGMSEAAVRTAIAMDFHLSGASVHDGENPVQRTAALRIRIADLVPGGGTAQIDYIFGYRGHSLIEVNILWSEATDPQMTPARLVANGATLSTYFARQGFAPQQTVQNGLLPDGSVLLFRSRDDAGHAVVLVLSGERAAAAAGQGETLTPTALTLVYAADPTQPDVFSLRKGSF